MKRIVTLIAAWVLVTGIAFGRPIRTDESGKTPREVVLPVENQIVKKAEAAEEEGINPVGIEIPKITLKKVIRPEGLNNLGLQIVPDENEVVSWYKEGGKPGKDGSAVLAGHNVWNNEPGAFARIRELGAGDKIYITGDGGKVLSYTVEKTAVYETDEFPTANVYGDSDKKRLNLITCHGKYRQGDYNQRLVVYATQD